MEKVCAVRESVSGWIAAFADLISPHKVTQTASNDNAGVNPHIWPRPAWRPSQALFTTPDIFFIYRKVSFMVPAAGFISRIHLHFRSVSFFLIKHFWLKFTFGFTTQSQLDHCLRSGTMMVTACSCFRQKKRQDRGEGQQRSGTPSVTCMFAKTFFIWELLQHQPWQRF